MRKDERWTGRSTAAWAAGVAEVVGMGSREVGQNIVHIDWGGMSQYGAQSQSGYAQDWSTGVRRRTISIVGGIRNVRRLRLAETCGWKYSLLVVRLHVRGQDARCLLLTCVPEGSIGRI